MKPTLDKSFPCALYGHNYIVTKENLDRTCELTCTHCDIEITTDTEGNFDSATISNSKIKETLQELYRLSHRFTNFKMSS